MDLLKVTVRLGNDLLNEATRYPVTPAEVVILREIHGSEGAVVNAVLRDFTDRDNGSEKRRLSDRYNPAIVDRLFPGYTPQLPQTAADVGLACVDESGTNNAVSDADPDEHAALLA